MKWQLIDHLKYSSSKTLNVVPEFDRGYETHELYVLKFLRIHLYDGLFVRLLLKPPDKRAEYCNGVPRIKQQTCLREVFDQETL